MQVPGKTWRQLRDFLTFALCVSAAEARPKEAQGIGAGFAMHYDELVAALLEIRDLQVRFGAVEAACSPRLSRPSRALLAAVPTLRTDRARPLAVAEA
jgi:hypothetical protein